MRASTLLFAVSLVAGAHATGGCATSTAAEPPAARESETASPTPTRAEDMRRGPMAHGERGKMAGMCPTAVEGTTVRTEDVEGGAAIVFTTTGDVGELRRRVARMAQMHERHHSDMATRGGGSPMMQVPPSTAHTENVEGGARLVVVSNELSDVPAVRGHVRAHAEKMASGTCPMMTGEMPGEEAGAQPGQQRARPSGPPES